MIWRKKSHVLRESSAIWWDNCTSRFMHFHVPEVSEKYSLRVNYFAVSPPII